MGYRDNPQKIQSSAYGLAEKIQILGVFLLHPEETNLLRTDPALLMRTTKYLSCGDKDDLTLILQQPIPCSGQPAKFGVGKQVFEKSPRKGIHTTPTETWRLDQPDVRWTIITHHFPKKRNCILLENQSSGKTLLIHKSALIAFWSLPQPAPGKAFPHGNREPDEIEDPLKLFQTAIRS